MTNARGVVETNNQLVNGGDQDPPQLLINAEQRVLGCCLLSDPAAWDNVADVVSESDFSRDDHRLIFGSIDSMTRDSKSIDSLTVAEHLDSKGRLEDAGGLAYLANIAREASGTVANVRSHAEFVAEHARLRQLRKLGSLVDSSIDEQFTSVQIVESLSSVLDQMPRGDRAQQNELLSATSSKDFLTPIEPETFLLPGIPIEAFTLLAGALSSFKTTLLIYLLLWKATGWDVLGFDDAKGCGCEPGKVLLLTYEDTQKRFFRKLRIIVQHGYEEISRRYNSQDADRFIALATANLRWRVFTGTTEYGLVRRVAGGVIKPNERFLASLIKEARTLAQDGGLLIGVDPLRLAIVGSQNDDDGADTVVHVLNRISMEIPGAAVLVCSHTNKATAIEGGSTTYTAAAYATSGSALYSQHARSNFLLTRPKSEEICRLFDTDTVSAEETEKQMVVRLTHGRLSHGAEEADRYFVMRKGTLSRIAGRGNRTAVDVIQSAGVPVLNAIERLKTSGVNPSKGALEKDTALVRTLGSRQALRGAVSLLLENGYIEVSGTTTNKNYMITDHGRRLMQSGENRRESPQRGDL